MSTNDVPGFGEASSDVLAMGCWAEHEDGSLIFVKSTEGQRIIYEMYDVNSSTVVQYTDAMLEDAFKKQFSWTNKEKNNKKNTKWSWHNRTLFPWDKVIKAGVKDGIGYASAGDQLSAAARVALSLSLQGRDLDPETKKHLMDFLSPASKTITSRLQEAISSLPIDDRQAEKKKKILLDAQKKLAAVEKPKGFLKRLVGRG
jgi:hypothetical protein